MSFNTKEISTMPVVVGTGLVVLDIIINNGDKQPIFNVGGTCANVLAGLSFLGWQSIAISRCGKDLAGDILLEDLLRNGIDINHISKEDKITTPRIIEKLSANGHYARHKFLLRCPSCNSYLPRFRSPRLDSLDDLLVSHKEPDIYFFDRVTPSSLKMARFYRESGALVFFEPNNLKHSEKLEEAIRLCHVLKYAGAETKKDIAEDNTDEFIKRIKSYCPPLVIKTLGKYGLLYRFAGDTKWKYQKGVKPDEIFDSCGAGDWCTASFIFYINELAQQNNLKLLDILKHNEFIRQSFSFAQILASISLRFVGARGLSNSMTKEDLFKNYQSYFNGSCETIFFTGRSKQKSKRMEVYNTKIKHKSAGCSTCLLNDKS